MPKTMTIGLDPARLAARLRERLVTRTDLARRLKISRMSVWCAATGRPVSVVLARRIARVLGTNVRALLGGNEAAQPIEDDLARSVGLLAHKGT